MRQRANFSSVVVENRFIGASHPTGFGFQKGLCLHLHVLGNHSNVQRHAVGMSLVNPENPSLARLDYAKTYIQVCRSQADVLFPIGILLFRY